MQLHGIKPVSVEEAVPRDKARPKGSSKKNAKFSFKAPLHRTQTLKQN
jgi:hypothetical protein